MNKEMKMIAESIYKYTFDDYQSFQEYHAMLHDRKVKRMNKIKNIFSL
jgi:hypothetical protein